jgi:hypothetical protein
VHVLLLRQAQADMEEAHATGVLQVVAVSCKVRVWALICRASLGA